MKEFTIGKMHIKTLVEPTVNEPSFEVFEFVIDKEGIGPSLHLHKGMDEIIYMISGSLEATTGQETHVLKEGDRCILSKGVPHIWKSLSPLKMLVIFTPSNMQVGFFTKLEEAIKHKIPWDDAIEQLAHEFDIFPI